MNNGKELLEMIKQYPNLPIIPMVGAEIVADESPYYWIGSWGKCKIDEYYLGREYVHFRTDDDEDILTDMVGCNYGETLDGRDIWDDLSDEEWDEIINNLPWVKAIVVYIDTPDD